MLSTTNLSLFFEQTKLLIDRSTNHFFKHHGILQATSLSYSTLFAIVPVTALLIFLSLQIEFFSSGIHHLREHLMLQLLPASREQVESYLLDATRNIKTFSYFTIAILLISTTWLSLSIEQTINEIWQVETPRKLTFRIPTHLILWILAPILMTISLSLTTWIVAQSHIEDISYISSFNSYALPWLISSVTLFLLYYFLPNTFVRFKAALYASMLAGLIFELSKYLFSIYISYFAMYDKLYGALAALPIFMLWVFIAWCIALWGISLCITIQSDKGQSK